MSQVLHSHSQTERCEVKGPNHGGQDKTKLRWVWLVPDRTPKERATISCKGKHMCKNKWMGAGSLHTVRSGMGKVSNSEKKGVWNCLSTSLIYLISRFIHLPRGLPPEDCPEIAWIQCNGIYSILYSKLLPGLSPEYILFRKSISSSAILLGR